MNAILKSLFLLLFVNTFLFSQQESGPVTYKIVSISTEGNKSYDSRTIVSNSGLVVGSEVAVPSDETHDAIQRLWNLKLFSDISIDVEKKIGNDAYLVIKVKELPKLDKVTFSGNDEFSDKDLTEKIGLASGQVLSPQSVKDIEFNIQK